MLFTSITKKCAYMQILPKKMLNMANFHRMLNIKNLYKILKKNLTTIKRKFVI